ncbi:PREDICTED: uncharacterized protein LOC106809758 [Priapulus caudatus]|uniref:Uncharacterized protein LOC106809758 n=1 Tax=Priapulus caudatus TaxID=37621 RepID=A0ABM1E8C4_PRICU|nr:PREDICTED: uncharacterized protein LOC106809758 [Priapulus caudatus]
MRFYADPRYRRDYELLATLSLLVVLASSAVRTLRGDDEAGTPENVDSSTGILWETSREPLTNAVYPSREARDVPHLAYPTVAPDGGQEAPLVIADGLMPEPDPARWRQRLNDDAYHVVQLVKEEDTGEVTVTVDTVTAVLTPKVKYVAVDTQNRLPVTVYMGGFPSAVAGVLGSDHVQYIGCMSDIQFQGDALKPTSSDMLQDGCVNQCDVANRCVKGTCINLYTNTTCDCFGTDFEGALCDNPTATEMTLQGYGEYFSYRLYSDADKVHTMSNRISVTFKTKETMNMLLFHGAGKEPVKNHITGVLTDGRFCIHLNFGDHAMNHTFSKIVSDDVCVNISPRSLNLSCRLSCFPARYIISCFAVNAFAFYREYSRIISIILLCAPMNALVFSRKFSDTFMH